MKRSGKTSSKVSKSDANDVLKRKSTPKKNIFLVETVLRSLFKQIESVSKLKDLRRMCQLWDRLDTDELEERAFQGRFKPINLTFYNEDSQKFKPLNTIKLELGGFLEDTRHHPKLFRSFAVIFPDSITFFHLEHYPSFFKDYSPTFLDLGFFKYFKFNENMENLLRDFVRWAAPTLRELMFRNVDNPFQLPYISCGIPAPKSFPVQHFIFPHLRKVKIADTFDMLYLLEEFQIIFTKGNRPKTPSLTSLNIGNLDLIDLLGLNFNPSRWAILTKLELSCKIDFWERAFHRFLNGLVTLARSGMTLKKLNLTLDQYSIYLFGASEFPQACQNLGEFFVSQANSLEDLQFSFKFHTGATLEGDKILLPVFKRLHTLSLSLDFLGYMNSCSTFNIFEFDSMLHNFPALEDLNILNFGRSMDAFFGESNDEGKRMNLKRLQFPIRGWEYGKDLHLGKHFHLVEEFPCVQDALKNAEKLGDLLNMIQVVRIRNIASELDLSAFKGLKRVIIEEDEKGEKSLGIFGLAFKEDKRRLIRRKYLKYFKKVAQLGLDSIIFRGRVAMFGEENRWLYKVTFPFRVQFEEELGPWFNDQDSGLE